MHPKCNENIKDCGGCGSKLEEIIKRLIDAKDKSAGGWDRSENNTSRDNINVNSNLRDFYNNNKNGYFYYNYHKGD